jgi:hypothetical protein
MRILNDIVTDWCYQCDDGCPNVKNETDLKTLKNILESDYKWNSNIVREFINNLQINNINKKK